MNVVLGFDTSCYTTSAAAVNAQGCVIGSCRMLLPVPSGQRGLRQSEAVFAHVRQLPQVMEELAGALERADAHVCAVAASQAPREGEESYMPVFAVGCGQAKVVASALRVPCYFVSHQQGHIAAGQIGGPEQGSRFVALHVSGGTTDLLLSDNGKLRELGGSLDLHAGQLVDRIGVAMGLPFPAGPALEALALQCREKPQALLPASMERGDLRCHLSGAEAQCMRILAKQALPPEAVALEVFDFLARTIARLLAAGCGGEKVSSALVVGGVASSGLLRGLVLARLQKAGSHIQVFFGKPEFSADNAAGVALLGMKQYVLAHGRG